MVAPGASLAVRYTFHAWANDSITKSWSAFDRPLEFCTCDEWLRALRTLRLGASGAAPRPPSDVDPFALLGPRFFGLAVLTAGVCGCQGRGGAGDSRIVRMYSIQFLLFFLWIMTDTSGGMLPEALPASLAALVDDFPEVRAPFDLVVD